MIRLIMFVLVCFSVSLPSYGVVFKCIKNDGTVYYQDKDCDGTDKQTMLNCDYRLPTSKEKKQIQRVLDKQKKQLQKQHQQDLRRKRIEAEKDLLDHKRRLRLEAKCEKVMRQIDDVTDEYRRGYTLRQDIVLKRKLAEYEEQKQRYCTYEQT